ncbi:MAG: hypothetical protein KIT33_07630 [Candidatus Kapabacteria bacterium]|nr:hypothetical protein [Ignavibacteriota bacterium]MCW5884823.1 hypothetical protein [Candidatus Kapabacteria bacterium]
MKKSINIFIIIFTLFILLKVELYSQVPTQQAYNIVFTNLTASGFTVVATKGNGTERIILVEEGTSVNSFPTEIPITNYTSNSNFSIAPSI